MATQAEIDRAIADGKKDMASTESTTRRRLQARYASSMELIEAELRTIALQLDAMDAGDLIGPRGGYTRQGRLWRQTHLERLLTLMDQEYTRNAVQGAQEVAAAQRQAVATGQQTARTMGLEGGVGPALNTEAYERLVAATSPGSPLVDVFAQFGVEAVATMEAAIIEGVMRGKGADAIVRDVRRQMGDGVPRWKVARIVRTEALRAFRGSLFTSYQQMGVREWQWVSTLSSRTCLACLAMHGRRFPISQDFMPSHPNCRCSPAPLVEGIGGQSGDAWFRSQPADWQRDRLGKAYDLYASGTIDLSAFVGKRHSRTWGSSITERSIRDVMEAAA